jgi:orotidine-5'-phosphate decarboxylase
MHSNGGLCGQCRIFYDGKFCDIPNTVAGAAKAVVARGVDIFNVHASCALASMKAVAENKGESKALAVTLLTSIGQANLIELGYPTSISTDVVVRAMATNAMKAGLDGIVCSPREIELVRRVMIEENKPDGIILTPGVRPAWSQTGDQKRTMTPGEAIKAGATALVIGRPITNPPAEIGSPRDALKRVLDEIASALGEG